jgi:uncharacterized membrane protein HdeD (DUF308 family)
MASPPPSQLGLVAKLLMLVGVGLVLVGAAVAALVEPWFIGAAVVVAGVGDLIAAFFLARRAQGG